MINRIVAGVLLVSTGSTLLPAAAAEADDGAGREQRLNPIVVTATRTPQRQAATLAPNTVITREEIERLQPRSMQELLRWTPGITIANSGGPGRLTSLFMRGTNSNHTVVLINGVRYDDISSGITAIQDLPVSHIQRIEIVRGPRSSLYGADAIGGVIQIFTRDGSHANSYAEPYIRLAGGSHGTYAATAGISGANEDSHYNVTLSRKDSGGFNACRGRPFAQGGGGCFVDQPDEDGYERTAGSLRAGFALGDAAAINVHALRIDSQVEFDGGAFVGDTSDNLRQVVGATISSHISDLWHTEVSVGHEKNETDNAYQGALVNRIDSSITSLRWQNDLLIWTRNRFTIGADYRDEDIDSSRDYAQTERDSTGVFAQYLGTFDRQQIQLALRADDYEEFDNPVTGSISYGWHLNSVHTITASYGTAFSAPTFDDLYFPFASNPDLEPEESKSFELGLKAERQWGRWAVTVYETKIDDLIALDPSFTPQNISQARIRGAEASIAASPGPWIVNASASWVDARNRSHGPNYNHELARRPQYSAQFRLDRRFANFSTGLGVRYGGARFDDPANTRKLDDYVLVGLRGSWDATDALRLQARVSNLFDADYETVAFFNQPDRTWTLSLSYHP